MKRFYSTLMMILVALLGGATEPDAGAHADALPAADSPMGAVQRLIQAYAGRDLQDYAAMLAARFHFDSSDPDFHASSPSGFTREDEIASADHLFHGFVNAAGAHLPAATSIEVTVADLHFASGPAAASLDEPIQVLVAEGLRLSVKLEDGNGFETGPLRHVFFVERALASEVAPGEPADPRRWIVRIWLENPNDDQLAAAAATTPSPDALAILRGAPRATTMPGPGAPHADRSAP
jgi:hypothetical protein